MGEQEIEEEADDEEVLDAEADDDEVSGIRVCMYVCMYVCMRVKRVERVIEQDWDILLMTL